MKRLENIISFFQETGKSSGNSMMKLKDIEPIRKQLRALKTHHSVKNFKKLKQVSSFFFKSSGLSLIKFNDSETIRKQVTAVITR